MFQPAERSSAESASVTLFLCGDVMTGRGIDQILPHPGKPNLYEPYMRSALGYVQIAEQVTGSIGRPVDFPYIWGDALAELERCIPTHGSSIWKRPSPPPRSSAGKGIHYRMHPEQHACLTAAGIDCCALANNHVLDWGPRAGGDAGDAARWASGPPARASRAEAAGAGDHRASGRGPRSWSSRSARTVRACRADWVATKDPRA